MLGSSQEASDGKAMGLSSLLMRKQNRVQRMMGQYMDIWIGCIRCYRDAWDIYLTQGIGEEFHYRVDATHKEESRADDKRREIEHALYAKALLPESRGDILGILETVDELLTMAEWSLRDVQLQEMKIPEELKSNLNKVVDMSSSCCEMVNKAVRTLFVGGKPHDVVDLVVEIDHFESEIDHIERSLIRTIFRSDLRKGDKLELKDLVRRLTKLSDAAEHVGDRLTLVSTKRRI